MRLAIRRSSASPVPVSGDRQQLGAGVTSLRRGERRRPVRVGQLRRQSPQALLPACRTSFLRLERGGTGSAGRG